MTLAQFSESSYTHSALEQGPLNTGIANRFKTALSSLSSATQSSIVSLQDKMAVHPSTLVSPQSTNSSSGPAQPIDVQAWTEQAAQSLNALSVTPPGGVRGTSVSLAIDLDEQSERKTVSGEVVANAYRHPRHKLLRRDSLERREALLKGKEGSRRRTRWENGSFIPLTKRFA